MRYEAELLSYLHANHQSMLDTVRDEKKLTDTTEGQLKAALESFGKMFS